MEDQSAPFALGLRCGGQNTSSQESGILKKTIFQRCRLKVDTNSNTDSTVLLNGHILAFISITNACHYTYIYISFFLLLNVLFFWALKNDTVNTSIIIAAQHLSLNSD